MTECDVCQVMLLHRLLRRIGRVVVVSLENGLHDYESDLIGEALGYECRSNAPQRRKPVVMTPGAPRLEAEQIDDGLVDVVESQITLNVGYPVRDTKLRGPLSSDAVLGLHGTSNVE